LKELELKNTEYKEFISGIEPILKKLDSDMELYELLVDDKINSKTIKEVLQKN